MKSVNVGRYREILGNVSFRNFWVGFVFSGVGDAMTRVALTWYVWEHTHSAAALGLLTFMFLAPVIVGGLVAGWLLDRYDQRKVIMADNLVRGFVVSLIPILYWAGALELWHVYAVAGVYGALMMISVAGGPAMVPSLVPEKQLATANALEVVSFTLSGVVGPPIAGLLLAQYGAPNVVIIDALTYFLFAFLLTRVVVPVEEAEEELKAGADGKAPGNKTYGLADGFRLMIQEKVLLSTTLMFMSFNIGMGMMFVWLPIYADEGLGGGASLYGILLGVIALGEVTSSILAGGMTFSRPLGTMISLAQILSGVSIAIALLDQNVMMTVASLALFGFFGAPLTIWAQTLRMKIIPAAMRGRVFALLRMLMIGAIPAGGVLAGWTMESLSMTTMIGLTSAFGFVPGVIGYRVRELRESDG
jgi:MFS family permease